MLNRWNKDCSFRKENMVVGCKTCTELMRKAMDAVRLLAQGRVKLAILKEAGNPSAHEVENWVALQEASKDGMIRDYAKHVSTHSQNVRTAGSER